LDVLTLRVPTDSIELSVYISASKPLGDGCVCQIYSRTPNPGREFIDTQKKLLGTLGYDEEDIKDTPQDCEETSMNDLQSMMANPGLENAMSNRFSSLGLSKGVQLNPFTSSLETLRKLIELYVPKFN
jgi:hypothetical protein